MWYKNIFYIFFFSLLAIRPFLHIFLGRKRLQFIHRKYKKEKKLEIKKNRKFIAFSCALFFWRENIVLAFVWLRNASERKPCKKYIFHLIFMWRMCVCVCLFGKSFLFPTIFILFSVLLHFYFLSISFVEACLRDEIRSFFRHFKWVSFMIKLFLKYGHLSFNAECIVMNWRFVLISIWCVGYGLE